MIFRQPDWFFHWLAPFYDYLVRTPQLDRLKDLLDLSHGDYLLDLGGGTGRVSHQFTGLGANVLICDINRSMLKQAKRKKGLMPLQADADRLPFPPDTFDAVLVFDALHHFSKPRHMVHEMLGVLKPGGRLLIEEQDINHFFIKLIQIAERIVGLHSQFLTQNEISALLPPTGHRLCVERGDFFAFRILSCKPTPP